MKLLGIDCKEWLTEQVLPRESHSPTFQTPSVRDLVQGWWPSGLPLFEICACGDLDVLEVTSIRLPLKEGFPFGGIFWDDRRPLSTAKVGMAPTASSVITRRACRGLGTAQINVP